MSKKLIIVNGPMGVGKTATCRELHLRLDKVVWLDGDWCWQMNPWEFHDENREMVMDNVTHLLGNFLRNSSFDYVLFSWVIHRPEILEEILGRLEGLHFELIKISLVCSARCLEARMIRGGRTPDQIDASVQRLALYQAMDTIKVDTTDLSVSQAADSVRAFIVGAV